MSQVTISISPIECGHDEIEAVIETICRLGKYSRAAKQLNYMITTVVQGRHIVLEPSDSPDNRRKFLDDVGGADIKGFIAVDGKVVWSSDPV